MQRRSFIANSIGFGLVTTPFMETFVQDIFSDPGGNVHLSAARKSPSIDSIVSRGVFEGRVQNTINNLRKPASSNMSLATP